jgi:hypothetical protein
MDGKLPFRRDGDNRRPQSVSQAFGSAQARRGRHIDMHQGVKAGSATVERICRSLRWSCSMGHLETCLGILRRLIAKGDAKCLCWAERAIEEYLEVTPVQARKSGLRYLQQDVLDQRNAVLGDQRNFADAVNANIEKRLEIL